MMVQAGSMEMYLRTVGNTNSAAPPIVFLHGMTLSSEDWEPVMGEFASEWNPLAPDLVGHGSSGAPDRRDPYRIDSVVDQLIEVLETLGINTAHWVGYSMGGRILLHLVTRHSERVSSMVLESSTPGIESAPRRKQRRDQDRERAAFLESRSLEEFVDRWMAAPVFDSQRSLPEEKLNRARRIRLRNNPVGVAYALRELSRGRVPSVWDQLEEITVPTLLITGERDEKHDRIHRRMRDALPEARMHRVPGAGHNVHFEEPEEFVNPVKSFLQDVEGTGRAGQ